MTTENGRDMFAQSGMATPGIPSETVPFKAQPRTDATPVADDAPRSPAQDHAHDSTSDSWAPSTGFAHGFLMLVSSKYKAAYAQYVAQLEAAREQKAQDILDYAWGLQEGIESIAEFRSGTVTVTHVKGGVAKTTNSVYIACTLGETAHTSVTAVDNNPMWGTTARLLGIEKTKTVREMFSLIEQGAVNNHREFIKKLGSNRNVSLIASDKVELRDNLYDHDTAKRVITMTQDNSIFVVNDTSNHIGGDAVQAALELSDVVVVPCITSSNGVEGTAVTMANYRAWGHSKKMRHAIVVVSALPEGKSAEDYRDQLGLDEHQTLIGIPYDPRLEADTVIDLNKTDPFTRIAYLELVYAIVRVMAHVQDNGYDSDPLRLTQGKLVSIPSGNSPELPYIRSSH